MAETTKTNIGLQFFKGVYGKDAALAKSTTVQGAIVFDETTKNIYVDGKIYGGASDVSFAEGVLTFSFTDGRNPIILDFNDTASATATLKVFERIDNLIGENVSLEESDGKLNYKNTNYLTEETTLVGADRALDAQMGVLTDGKKYTDEQISEEAKQALNNNAIVATGEDADTLGDAIHKVDNKVDAVVDELIKDEEVITTTFSQVRETMGAEDDFTINFNEAKGDDLKAATNIKAGILAVEKELTDIVEDLDVENVQTITVTEAGQGDDDYTDGITLNFKGVTEEDGKIKQGTRTETQKFAKVATSGESEDTHYDATDNKIIKGTTENPIIDVQAAIDAIDAELAAQVGGMRYNGGIANSTATLNTQTEDIRPGDIYLATGNFTIADGENKTISVEPGDMIVYKGEKSTETVTLTSANCNVIEKEADLMVTADGTLTDDYIMVGAGNKSIRVDETEDKDPLTVTSVHTAQERAASALQTITAEEENENANNADYVNVTITEKSGEDGEKTQEISSAVQTADAKFVAAKAAEDETEATPANLIVDTEGNEEGLLTTDSIAEIKSYVDAKASDAQVDVTNNTVDEEGKPTETENDDAIVIDKTENETTGKTSYNVRLCWSEWNTTTTIPDPA